VILALSSSSSQVGIVDYLIPLCPCVYKYIIILHENQVKLHFTFYYIYPRKVLENTLWHCSFIAYEAIFISDCTISIPSLLSV